MSELTKKKCTPCKGGTIPMAGAILSTWQHLLPDSWHLILEHHLEKEYQFKNFSQALDFTVRVGAIAEAEGHHPVITLSWGNVKLAIWTHKINGLTENDFILAAKCDALLDA